MRKFYLFIIFILTTGSCLLLAQEKTNAVARGKQIQELLNIVTNDEIAQKDRPKVVQAILKLGEINAVEAAPQLAEKLDFFILLPGQTLTIDEQPRKEEIYPAVKALKDIGKPTEPTIISAVASKERTDLFLENARITLFCIYGANKQWAVKDALTKAAEKEKDKQKAKRIKNFAEMIQPQYPRWYENPPKREGTLAAEDQKSGDARRQQIQELLAVVTDDEIAQKDRPKVVQAILKLGELKAVEAVPQLAEKLDFHISATGRVQMDEPPSPEEIFPAIKALMDIGKPAEPAIIAAVASKDRPVRFLINARTTLIFIYGDNNQWAVKDALTKAAEQEKDKEKAKRIKDLAESIKPPFPRQNQNPPKREGGQ